MLFFKINFDQKILKSLENQSEELQATRSGMKHVWIYRLILFLILFLILSKINKSDFWINLFAGDLYIYLSHQHFGPSYFWFPDQQNRQINPHLKTKCCDSASCWVRGLNRKSRHSARKQIFWILLEQVWNKCELALYHTKTWEENFSVVSWLFS